MTRLSQHPLRSRLILLAITLLCLILSAEIVLRVFYPSDRLEYQADDVLLWRFRPNQIGWVDVAGPMRRSPLVTINSLGYRGAELDPADTRERILALGDSYTFGSGVADSETFCTQLEALSGGRFRVVNGGMQGWGVFQMEARLERDIDLIAPRFVLVTIPEGDVYRQPFNSDEERARFLWRTRLANRVRRVSRLVTVVSRTVEQAYLAWSGRSTANALPSTTNESSDSKSVALEPTDTFRELWNLDRARLLAMRDIAERHGSQLIVAGWPQATRNTSYFLNEIRALASVDILAIDLSESLGGYWDQAELSIPIDGHPSPTGHDRVARQILNSLGMWSAHKTGDPIGSPQATN